MGPWHCALDPAADAASRTRRRSKISGQTGPAAGQETQAVIKRQRRYLNICLHLPEKNGNLAVL
jgi:hypothetical protein